MSTPQAYASTINSFYLAFYGRPADPAGLKFWASQLASNNGDAAPIIQAFATSAETQFRFAADSVAERIAEIYQQLFNRAPDSEGLRFYTEAIEQGKATLADVSIAILNGARDSDKTLSEMRQQAADAFTARVEASGSAYDGYASIEAARVLVRAVTMDTKPADMDALVKAAVAFSDVATKTPEVVGAIASGGPLLAMFDTARGLAEPVALLQSLADTAKAAAGNPDTLESLLRGGGMTKVLQVMPAKATLQDVVDALSTGGLPAAVEVVYPTTKPPVVVPKPTPTPEPALKLAFDHVSESTLDSKHDNVTNVAVADITFKYSGNDLVAGQKFIASIDGGATWDQVELKTDAETNTVTAVGVHLAPKVLDKLFAESSIGIQATAPQNRETTIMLQAVDANGKVFGAITQPIVYDGYAAAPGLAFAAGVSSNGYLIDDSLPTAASKTYELEGIEPGATVEYASTPQPVLDQNGDMSYEDPEWNSFKPTLTDGVNTFMVRQRDAAGNTSVERTVEVRVDVMAPVGKPVIALVEDSGPDNTDGYTNIPRLAISGLDKGKGYGNGWEYSTDNGKTWTFGGKNDDSGKAELDLSDLGANLVSLKVRQLDTAGNVSEASQPLTFQIDTKAPANVLSFDRIVGNLEAGTNVTTENTVDVRFKMSGSLPYDGIVEWRYKDGGETWTALGSNAFASNGVDSTVLVSGVDLSQKDQTIEIRMADYAGNHGETFSQPIDGPVDSTPRFSVAPGVDGIQVTSNVKGVVLLKTATTLIPLATSAPSKGAIDGTTTILAPNVASTGTVSIMLGNDAILDDEKGQVFTLGTDKLDGPEELTGHYVYGFGGYDRIFDTAGDDYLVGGAGYDQIYLMNGGNDTVVIAPGDTAINATPYLDRISSAGMDMISYATVGDMLQIGKVFTAKPTLQTGFLVDPSANHYAIVRGEERGGTFSPGEQATHTSYLIQWADGTNVHSIILVNIGTTAPAFEFDIEKGTMTLATPQESQEPETPVQPPVVTPDPEPVPAEPTDPEPEPQPNEPTDPEPEPQPTEPAETQPPIDLHYANFGKTFDGVTIDTDVYGNMYSTQANGSETAVFADGSSVPQLGVSTIGAQPLATSGTIWYDAPGGPYSDGVKYTLGTNSRDQALAGQNVWGFNGDDKITGTADSDFLVGGKGVDTIDVGNDDASDTVVFAAGDTLTGMRSSGSVSGMDVVANLHVGDVIQLGDVFSGAVSQSFQHLDSVAANQVGIVRGHLFEGVFTEGSADNLDVSWLVEWSDGTNVNSVVLANLGNLAPQFTIDAQSDTMTLASLVGVGNSEEGSGPGIPG